MKLFFVPFITFIILFSSCKSIQEEISVKTNLDNIELGVVGEQEKDVFDKSYQIFGLPHFNEKIKLSLDIKEFNKYNYNRYRKSISKQDESNNVKYIDSIAQKPYYIEIEIIISLNMLIVQNVWQVTSKANIQTISLVSL